MFSSALVALKPSATELFVIDYALAIAQQLNAELASCTVIDVDQIAPPEAIPVGGGAYKKEWDEKLIADARKVAGRVAATCQSEAAKVGVSCQTDVVDGRVAATIAQEVQVHDLLVLGHSAGDPTNDEALLFKILKRVPRPTIVFPKRRVEGANVLVAFDGSVQAARTLASFAHSGLSRGRTVHVVSCHSDYELAVRQSELAGRFLTRHGLGCELHAETGAPEKVVLSLAEQISAGLLVMGAFGQATVREFFFGSTTRSILHELPLPVFLDH